MFVRLGGLLGDQYNILRGSPKISYHKKMDLEGILAYSLTPISIYKAIYLEMDPLGP